MMNIFRKSESSGRRAGRFAIALIAVAVPLFAVGGASAQALPAAEASPISTGFSIPSVGGSLHWAVSASSSLDWGYYSQSGAATGVALSGNVGYLSQSTYRPFSLVATGGRSWGWSGQPSYEFASLGMSQGINVGRWSFTFSDNVSYLPQTAIGSLSGIAGLGDLGVPPVQTGPDIGQGALTNYSPQVSNTGGASMQRQITGKTALNASGSYSILRFVGGSGSSGAIGLENDSVTGSAGLNHRLNARNTFGGNYTYSSVIFLQNTSNGIPEPNFISQSGSLTYTHQVNRRLSFNLAAGPQWTTISLGKRSTSLNAYADATLNYATEFARMGLGYVHGTNAGYGVVGGSLSDSVTFSASHSFSQVWNTAANLGWTHTTQLPSQNAITTFDLKTVIVGLQVSRALARSLSAYASYTFEDQTSGSTGSTINLFSGKNNIIAFGVTYSPASRRVGRH